MIEAIELAIHEGKILCGFTTREECKDYVRTVYPDLDAFDVTIEAQYLSGCKPAVGTFNR